MMADKAAQHPSKSLNIDLSSSVRGPEQDPTSQPMAETLSEALLNGCNAFRVNCDWPPQTSAMLCARPMKWEAASRTGRCDRADGIGVSVVDMMTDAVSEKR